jgi:hypothetical protein
VPKYFLKLKSSRFAHFRPFAGISTILETVCQSRFLRVDGPRSALNEVPLTGRKNFLLAACICFQKPSLDLGGNVFLWTATADQRLNGFPLLQLGM